MTSLLFLFARNLDQLAMLPEKIFTPVPQILLIFFSNSDILGTEQHLPDGLLRGLSKLMYFSFDYISYLSVPSMVDCTALQVFYGGGPSGARRGIWHLDDAENEATLEGLVSLTTFQVRSQCLTRIPSLKDCGKLGALNLAGNLITSIRPGDFKGAASLMILNLATNLIVSIADEAFNDLAKFTVLPQDLDLTNADGSPYVPSAANLNDTAVRTHSCTHARARAHAQATHTHAHAHTHTHTCAHACADSCVRPARHVCSQPNTMCMSLLRMPQVFRLNWHRTLAVHGHRPFRRGRSLRPVHDSAGAQPGRVPLGGSACVGPRL